MESLWAIKPLKEHCIALQVTTSGHMALGGFLRTLVAQSIFVDTAKLHEVSLKIMIQMSVVHSAPLKCTTRLSMISHLETGLDFKGIKVNSVFNALK